MSQRRIVAVAALLPPEGIVQLQALAVLLAAAQQARPAHPLQIHQAVLLEMVHLRISMDVLHSMVEQGPLIRLVLVELNQTA